MPLAKTNDRDKIDSSPDLHSLAPCLEFALPANIRVLTQVSHSKRVFSSLSTRSAQDVSGPEGASKVSCSKGHNLGVKLGFIESTHSRRSRESQTPR